VEDSWSEAFATCRDCSYSPAIEPDDVAEIYAAVGSGWAFGALIYYRAFGPECAVGDDFDLILAAIGRKVAPAPDGLSGF
jgi:hypothetical protein